MFKDKRRVYLVREMNGVYSHLRTLSVLPHQKHIRFKLGKDSKTMPLDTGKPAFRIGNAWVYFVDIFKGQMGFQASEFKIDTDMIDTAVAKGTIKNIIAGMQHAPMLSYILYIIMGALIGIFAGYILGVKFPM